MQPLFSTVSGWMILFSYLVIMVILTYIFAWGYQHSKVGFLAADRKITMWPAAFSIAATWIWAPALFIAAQKAYQQGIVGLFWFTVPNAGCLIVFAWFAKRLRDKVPEGFTLTSYMENRFSKRVHFLYLVQFIGLAACCFAVQLLAGGAVIATLTGVPYWQITIGLALIPIIYTMIGGLKASVMTDYFQDIVILVVGFLAVGWAASQLGGLSTIAKGLGGIDGKHWNLFNADGLAIFFSFGLPATIGLMAGPFGDQSFYQRAFGIEKSHVMGAFVWGAILFVITPLTLSLLGFMAAGSGLTSKDPQLINLEVVVKTAPPWLVIAFVYMLLSGLISTLDSALAAMSSIAGHDLLPKTWCSDKDCVRAARHGIWILALGGVLIANIPGLKILYLWLFYGTLRASTLLPTVISLVRINTHVSETGVFWGILLAILVGLPIFAYGNFTQQTTWIVIGSITTIGISGLCAYIASVWFPVNPSYKEAKL